jgi:hypothetical protein
MMDTMTPAPGEDVLTARETLVDLITDEIQRVGYFTADVDPAPHQVLIDVRWAAQIAGRRLGRPTRTFASAIGKRHSGKVTVIVAPVEGSDPTEPQSVVRVRAAVEHLLDRRADLAVARSA